MDTDFDSMTLAELQEEAKRLDIKGRSQMNKDELATALRADEDSRRDDNVRIAVLTASVGKPLILRSNPSEEEVKDFVREHNRRHEAGEAGGPDGYPAVRILEAVYYSDEESFVKGEVDSQGEEIDLSDVL